MKLSNYFLKRKVRYLLEQTSSRKRCFRNLADAKDILLLYSLEDKEEVDACIQKLESLNKNIYHCVCVPGKLSVPGTTDEKFLYVNESTDTNIRNVPDEKVLQAFKCMNADILIDLTQANNHVMHYLMLSHPCELKVGKKNDSFPLYDLAISFPEEKNICYLFDNIVFYLQSIRSK